jgi:hypothetical protein
MDNNSANIPARFVGGTFRSVGLPRYSTISTWRMCFTVAGFFQKGVMTSEHP